MAKKTLLDIVQDILNDTDGDEVNSISDTLESMQIAQIVRTTYEEIISNRYWPTNNTLLQLQSSGDSSKPTHMKLPDDVQDIDWIKYDKQSPTDTRTRFEDIIHLYPDQFIEHLNARNSDTTDVTVVTDDSGISLNILNNRAPAYYTSFDDKWIVFDSFDSEVDSILRSSKTQVYAVVEPVFQLKDDYVPELPAKVFPYLIAEAKSVTFNSLKQVPNAKEEQRSRRQRGKLAREKHRVEDGFRIRSVYGRTTKK